MQNSLLRIARQARRIRSRQTLPIILFPEASRPRRQTGQNSACHFLHVCFLLCLIPLANFPRNKKQKLPPKQPIKINTNKKLSRYEAVSEGLPMDF